MLPPQGVRENPNPRIATVLVLQVNLGLHIGDICDMSLSNIVKEGNRYRLDIVEQKTHKKRVLTVPAEVYTYIQKYALQMGINPKAFLFNITVRAVQKVLQQVTGHGIVGRIIPYHRMNVGKLDGVNFLSLSAPLYYRKAEHFDKLVSTHKGGSYMLWIDFFVCSIHEAARQAITLIRHYDLLSKGLIPRRLRRKKGIE